MERALAVLLKSVALLAFASTGCGGSKGLAVAGHDGAAGTAAAGQTGMVLDGGPGTVDSRPWTGGATDVGGAAGQNASTGGVTASGGAAQAGRSGGTESSAGGLTGSSANRTGGASTVAGGNSAGIISSTGGGTSAGGTTGRAGSISLGTGTGGGTSSGGNTSKTGGSQTGGGGTPTGGTSGLGGTPATGGSSRSSTCLAHESEWPDSSGARCVATLVSVPGLAIDATEATRGQYAAWLKTNPPTAGQSGACSWNTSFAPDATCMANASVCQGEGCDTHPQPCVDMCDAAAYCAAIGRGLCSDASWLKTCTSDGTYSASYGTSFARGKCNDYTLNGSTTVPVASKSECQAPASSPFTGVFDLIGNLEEWVDNCRASEGANDGCYTRGLPFGLGAAAPLCSQSTYTKRSGASPTIGFRCCTP